MLNPTVNNTPNDSVFTKGYRMNGNISNTIFDSSSGITYVSGSFSNLIGSEVADAVVVNTDGTIDTTIKDLRVPAGTVYGAVSDGNGGHYVYGYFKKIKNENRFGLAHIKSDGSLGPLSIKFDRPNVKTAMIDGTTLYIGGDFSSINGLTRNGAAAIDLASGALLSWNPDILSGGTPSSAASGYVYGFIKSGSSIYIYGQFDWVGGISRVSLALVNATTGSLESWNTSLGPNSRVSKAIISGSTMYVVGYISSIGGSARQHIGAVDATTGATLSFGSSITTDGQIYSMDISGTTIYIAGSFATINGTARKGFAALNTSQTLLSWNPNVATPYGIYGKLLLDGGTVYISAGFWTVGGTTRYGHAAVDATSAALLSWYPALTDNIPMSSNATNDIGTNGIFKVNGKIFIATAGVKFLSVLTRKGLCAFDRNGNPTSWAPSLTTPPGYSNANVYGMEKVGSSIYVVGYFYQANGVDRNAAAAFDLSGNLLSWNPNITMNYSSGYQFGSPLGMAFDSTNSIFYIVGGFKKVGATLRTNHAAVDINGSLLSWTYTGTDTSGTYESMTRAIKFYNNKIYIAGEFAKINGTLREAVAVILPNGSLDTSFNIPTGYGQKTACFSNTTGMDYIFDEASGGFGQWSSSYCTNWYGGYWDTRTGTLPSLSGSASSIFVDSSGIYLGASVSSISGDNVARTVTKFSHTGQVLGAVDFSQVDQYTQYGTRNARGLLVVDGNAYFIANIPYTGSNNVYMSDVSAYNIATNKMLAGQPYQAGGWSSGSNNDHSFLYAEDCIVSIHNNENEYGPNVKFFDTRYLAQRN